MTKKYKYTILKIPKAYIFILAIIIVGVIGSGLYSFNNNNISVNTTSALSGDLAEETKNLKPSNRPFDMPSTQTLQNSPRKVFGHYFTPYPLSIDNKLESDPDYYAKNYINPNPLTDDEKKHTLYGGFFRQRPLPRTPIATDYKIQDKKTEITRAMNAGLDGFTLNMLSIASGNLNRQKQEEMLNAANQLNNGFKIMLMPDMNSLANSKPSYTTLADYILFLKNTYPNAVYKIGTNKDTLVVSPYNSNDRDWFATDIDSYNYWKSFKSYIESKGQKVALVPCPNGMTSSYMALMADISYGFSEWGGRSPTGSIGSKAIDAHSYSNPDGSKKIWMQPVSLQDLRPKAGIYWEAENTTNLRHTWYGAMGKATGGVTDGISPMVTNSNAVADWVQIPTWNDYSESTEISPSTHTGWSPLDLVAYYTAQYKSPNFTAPAITRDGVYVSHRVQKYANLPNGSIPCSTNSAGTQFCYTKFMTLNSSGTKRARDKLEVLAFMRSDSTIKVTSGSVVTNINVSAGLSSNLVDLQYGNQKVEATNSNGNIVVNSPYAVKSNFAVQDLQYYFVSSLREGTTTLNDNKQGDIDKNGIVNVFDLAILLSNWNTNNTICDLKKDGIVNAFDLSMLLSNWTI